MQLIPVADLMDGQVVRAVRGDRANYRPLTSNLVQGSTPEVIVGALLQLYPFRTFYLADLDAILGRGHHKATIETLRRQFPTVEFWVDAGFQTQAEVEAWLGLGLATPVIGSETLRSASLFADLDLVDSAVLSLDYRGESFTGPAELEAAVERWPNRVIAMTLGRVGSQSGPDTDRLSALKTRAPTRRLYAAGGVRGASDLATLTELGAAGVLLASALHDGALGSADLARYG